MSSDPTAELDPDRFGQVLSNLVGNAIEHGVEGRPVRVEVRCASDRALVTVHNDGEPIASELLPVLFDPFRTGPRNGRRSRGLGLGLFIADQIVRGHGGELRVRSVAGEGTTFTVELPLSPSEATEPTAAERQRVIASMQAATSGRDQSRSETM